METNPLSYESPPPPKGNRWRVLGWTLVAIIFAMLALVIAYFVYLFVGWHFGWIEPI